MSLIATAREHVPEALSDQDLLPISGFGATSDEAFLSGARQILQHEQIPRAPEQWDSDTATIPLLDWLQAILPSIREIESLEHNWDSYGSPPPSKELVSEVLLLLHLTELDFPPPTVVPVSGGGMQLEWYLAQRELEVEFGQDAQAVFVATDLTDHRSYEGTFYRTDYNVMRELIGWLSEA